MLVKEFQIIVGQGKKRWAKVRKGKSRGGEGEQSFERGEELENKKKEGSPVGSEHY